MSTLYIEEYSRTGFDQNRVYMPNVPGDSIANQSIGISASNAISAKVQASTYFVILVADVDCYVTISATPDATIAATRHLLPAGCPRPFFVQPDLSRIAVAAAPAITSGATGIAAGEAHMGEVGGNIISISSQFGPSSSTTYTAGQVLAGTTELAGMGRIAGGTGLMVGASLELAMADNTSQVDLVIFSAQPAGTYTAGATFALDSRDRDKVSKVIKLTDWTSLGASDSFGEATPGPKFYKCADGTKTTSLWVVAVTRGAITLTSTTSGTLRLRGARN